MKIGTFLLGAAAGAFAYHWYAKNKGNTTSPAANIGQALDAFISNVEKQAQHFSQTLKNYKMNVPQTTQSPTAAKADQPIINM